MSTIKLSEWCNKSGVAYITAYRWFKAGKFPVPAYQTDSGTILVEDISPSEQAASSAPNDAMSLFLKKTVEFSKNGSSVEDFAAFVISNFQLRLNGTTEGPKYSRQKPKPEDVQKHFQQFIPKGEKPKPNSFVMDPRAFEDIRVDSPPAPRTDVDQNLVKEFSQAVETPDSPPGFVSTYNPVAASTPGAAAGSMSTAEGMVNRSVDLNTTPQPINYTGSTNPTLGSSLNLPTNASVSNCAMPTHTFYSGSGIGSLNPNSVIYTPDGNTGVFTVYGTTNPNLDLIGKALENEPVEITEADPKLNQSRRSKRGRKPSKR